MMPDYEKSDAEALANYSFDCRMGRLSESARKSTREPNVSVGSLGGLTAL